MILADNELHVLLNAGLLDNYSMQHVGPCSVDLNLGDEILIELPIVEGMEPWDLRKAPYRLAPGEFILARTSQIISMPEGYAGELALRSTAARLGLDHHLAAYIDSGFHGSITLELHNAKRYQHIELKPEMRIAQLIVHKLSSEPKRSYSKIGNYQNQVRPTPSNLNL